MTYEIIKQNNVFSGLSHTFGMLSRKGIKAERDAEVVCRLRKAGKIFFSDFPIFVLFLVLASVLHLCL